MSIENCCHISKVNFDKPYQYSLSNLVLDNELISSIPAFQADMSGIWQPLFHNNNTMKIAHVSGPDIIKDWSCDGNITYSIAIDQTQQSGEVIIPFWYRYYRMDIDPTKDNRILPGIELYISDGEYWKTSSSSTGNITNNLKHDAEKIYSSLSGLGIYSTGTAYEYAKILATGPQLDWITEILSSGTGLVSLSDRNEYGLDKDKLKQMSLKTKKSYGSPNYVLNKADLINAFANKYNGYFWITPGTETVLTSKFDINPDVHIDWSIPIIDNYNNQCTAGYINFKVDIGIESLIVRQSMKQIVEPNILNIGYGTDELYSLPNYFGLSPDKQYPRYAPYYTGIPMVANVNFNPFDINHTQYYLFGIDLGNPTKSTEVMHWVSPIKQCSFNSDNHISYFPIRGVEFHRLGGVRFLSDNFFEDLNTTFGYSPWNPDSTIFFYESQQDNFTYESHRSNIKIHFSGSPGLLIKFTKNQTLTINQLRNDDHPDCTTFINKEFGNSQDVSYRPRGTRLACCLPLSFQDPRKKIFDNTNSLYTPGIKSIRVSGYGGLSYDEMYNTNDDKIILDTYKIYKDHVPENGGFIESFFPFNLSTNILQGTLLSDIQSDNCTYTIEGSGNYNKNFIFPGRGIIKLNYITDSGNFFLSAPESSYITNTKSVAPSGTMVNQNGILCFDKKYTNTATNPDGDLVTLDIKHSGTFWGATLTMSPEILVQEPYYPMIQNINGKKVFFHPNSGLTEDPLYIGKSPIVPHRYGNKSKSTIYEDTIKTSWPNTTKPTEVNIYKHINIPIDSSDPLNNYYASDISLIGYNTEKLYNRSFIDGINILIDTNNNFFEFTPYTREIIDQADYFGFIKDNKYRYITTNFHKFKYTKLESPILEHIDFNFHTMDNADNYPYNDLYVKEHKNNLITVSSFKNMNDRIFSFFDDPINRLTNETIIVVPIIGSSFETSVININKNILQITDVPTDIDLIGAKIIKKNNPNTKSLMISQNFATINDTLFNFGKWGHISIYSPYNHPTGLDKYNLSSIKTIEAASGQTYNPYISWASLVKIQNYDANGILAQEPYSIFYQPHARLLSNIEKTNKLIETIGIGHNLDFSTELLIRGDKIISFQNEINRNKAYFFVGKDAGQIGISITIRNLQKNGKIILTYKDIIMEQPIDGTAGQLDNIDPYYMYGFGPFQNNTGTIFISALYQNGDKTTVKFILNKSYDDPVFGFIELIDNNTYCLNQNLEGIPHDSGYAIMDIDTNNGYYLINSPNNSMIEFICVFYNNLDNSSLSDVQKYDRIHCYKHATDNYSKDYFPYLDYHIYDSTQAAFIAKSGIINFENVFTLKTGSYYDNMPIKYDSTKYWVDVQKKTADFGILTKQNWFLSPYRKYLFITDLSLLECNDRTKLFYNDLCDPKRYHCSRQDIETALDINLDDFNIKNINYEIDIRDLNNCCIDNLINTYPEVLNVPIFQSCVDSEISIKDFLLSKYNKQKIPNANDTMYPCEPNFTLEYKVQIVGYELEIKTETIFDKLLSGNNNYIFGTGDLIGTDNAGIVGGGSSSAYPVSLGDEREPRRIIFDGNIFYSLANFYGTISQDPNKFLTSKMYTSPSISDLSCRNPGIHSPLFKHWINSVSDREDREVYFATTEATTGLDDLSEGTNSDTYCKVPCPDAIGPHGSWVWGDKPDRGEISMKKGGYYVFEANNSIYSKYINIKDIKKLKNYLSFLDKASGIDNIVIQYTDVNGNRAFQNIDAASEANLVDSTEGLDTVSKQLAIRLDSVEEGEEEPLILIPGDLINSPIREQIQTSPSTSEPNNFDITRIVDVRLIDNPFSNNENYNLDAYVWGMRKPENYLLSSQEILQNESLFRKITPHPEKISFPLYDYSRQFPAEKVKVVHTIDIRNKKCIRFTRYGEAIKLFQLILSPDKEGKEPKLQLSFSVQDSCNSLNLIIQEQNNTTNNYVLKHYNELSNGIKTVSYSISKPVNTFTCKDKDFIPSIGSDDGPSLDMDPNYRIKRSEIDGIDSYECYNCYTHDTPCSYSISYSSFTNNFIIAQLEQDYDNACSGLNADTEWSATQEAFNENAIQKVKTNIPYWDRSFIEQVKKRNYTINYCGRTYDSCINTLLDPYTDIRECCDNHEIFIRLEIIAYHDCIILNIKNADPSLPLITTRCLYRNGGSEENVFRCPGVRLELEHEEIYFTDVVRSTLLNCTNGTL